MTKAAELALVNGLAQLTKGTAVTVNGVLPGPTASDGVTEFVGRLAAGAKQTPAEFEKEFFHSVRPTSLRQRFARVDEVASLVAYLCSPPAAATNGLHLYASCGSGGHPAGRRAGRPARRKNAPRPGKVELFARPVETRALDPAARCRQLRQAGRPPSPRLWRTGPPLQKSRSVPAVAIETDKCVSGADGGTALQKFLGGRAPQGGRSGRRAPPKEQPFSTTVAFALLFP